MKECNITDSLEQGLSGTQFSTLKILESMIPKYQKNKTKANFYLVLLTLLDPKVISLSKFYFL
jgi:hypothetical protein